MPIVVDPGLWLLMGTGAHGSPSPPPIVVDPATWLLFSMGSTSTPAILTLPEAIVAAIRADPTLTSLMGGRIYPGHLPEAVSPVYPAVEFRVVSRGRNHRLNGSDGTVDARVEFAAYSTLYLEVEAIVTALFNLFDGLTNASLSGVRILFALAEDDLEDFEDGDDGSDAGTFTDTITILFRHRISIPTR